MIHDLGDPGPFHEYIHHCAGCGQVQSAYEALPAPTPECEGECLWVLALACAGTLDAEGKTSAVLPAPQNATAPMSRAPVRRGA